MTSILTPFEFSGTQQLERRLFRKKVLPVGSVTYEGRNIDFTPEYLNTVVASFNDSAFDNIPLQFAGDDNKHTNKIERYRGDVVGMAVEDDGLYVTVAATAQGAKWLAENPKMGISARIINDYERSDGKHYEAAVQHVLATHDPRIPGLGPWATVDSFSNETESDIIDLTAEKIADKNTQEEKSVPDKDDDKLSNDELAQLRALLTELDNDAETEDVDDELTDAELQDLLDSLDEDEVTDAETPELIEASNPDNGKALELANEHATELSRIRGELDEQKWSNERETLMRKSGLPPVILDKAAPLLKGTGHVLEFSNGDTVDAGAVMRDVLAEVGKLAKLLDLSNELGDSEGLEPDTSEEASARRDETTKAVRAMMGN